VQSARDKALANFNAAHAHAEGGDEAGASADPAAAAAAAAAARAEAAEAAAEAAAWAVARADPSALHRPSVLLLLSPGGGAGGGGGGEGEGDAAAAAVAVAVVAREEGAGTRATRPGLVHGERGAAGEAHSAAFEYARTSTVVPGSSRWPAPREQSVASGGIRASGQRSIHRARVRVRACTSCDS
jgi:hypothetical protein